MKIYTRNNKTMDTAYHHFINSYATQLNDLYNNYSRNKVQAYNYCREYFDNLPNASHFTLWSANTYTFSCGFIFKTENEIIKLRGYDLKPNTTYFIYFTRDYDRVIPLDLIRV